MARPEHCSTVHGEYAIYANNDYLRVRGNKHPLIVVIDALDKELEKAGWERTAAYGRFVLCSKKDLSPAELTNRDAIRVKSYSHIQLLPR